MQKLASLLLSFGSDKISPKPMYLVMRHDKNIGFTKFTQIYQKYSTAEIKKIILIRKLPMRNSSE